MPVVIRKVRNKNCWTVKDEKTGKIHSKCSSLAKAKAQSMLLNGLFKSKKMDLDSSSSSSDSD